MVITETSTVHLSYYSDRIIVSKESLLCGSVREKKKEVMLQNRSTVYNGFMSPATKRKVRTILNTWFNAIRFQESKLKTKANYVYRKLTFATLTLSGAQKHDDNWVKRNMLNRFIVHMQRKYDIKYYFWRAEKQRNGRIHFHVIFDCYIDKRELQSAWNNIQQEHGYLDSYFAAKRRYNAPSTHIKAVPQDSSAIDYVLKYVSKNPDDIEDAELKVKGRIWGCSSELKSLKPYSTGELTEVGQSLTNLVKSGQAEVIDREYFMIYFLDTERFIKKFHVDIYNDMKAYYVKMYERLYVSAPESARISEIVEEPINNRAKAPEQLSLFAEMYLDDNSIRRRVSRNRH